MTSTRVIFLESSKKALALLEIDEIPEERSEPELPIFELEELNEFD
jgi:hypothetical protein